VFEDGRPYPYGCDVTNTVDSTTDSAQVESPRHQFSPWPVRLGRGVFIVAYLVFAAVTVATIQSGLHGDPARTNPHPGPARFARSLAKALEHYHGPIVHRGAGIEAKMFRVVGRFTPTAVMHQMVRVGLGQPRFGAMRPKQ
jgi:hypothetical protein